MIVTCRREHLEERCLQRGYSFSSVLGCIVSDSGDVISVDTGHADYPVERVGSLSFTCVPDCNYPEFACGVGECCEESPFGGTNGCVPCVSSSSSSVIGSSSSSVSGGSSSSSVFVDFGACCFGMYHSTYSPGFNPSSCEMTDSFGCYYDNDVPYNLLGTYFHPGSDCSVCGVSSSSSSGSSSSSIQMGWECMCYYNEPIGWIKCSDPPPLPYTYGQSCMLVPGGTWATDLDCANLDWNCSG